MPTTTDEEQNRADNYRPPKHSAARTLWKIPLSEWQDFQNGDITAHELKQQYGGDE